MNKIYLFLVIGFGFIQLVSTDCVNGMLYCFDSNGIRYPKEIIVGQCWKWKKLACEPCNTVIKNGLSSYEKYLSLCRYRYPNTVLVLETKSVWGKKIKDIIETINRFEESDKRKKLTLFSNNRCFQ